MKRSWRRWAVGPVLVVLAGVGLVAAPADAAKRPYCGQAWGSYPKQLGNNDPGFPPTLLRGVRPAPGPCFDRLVFDLGGPAIGYRAQYVPQVVSDASGEPIPLRGGAFLSIVLAAPAYDANERPTYQPADRSNAIDVRGYQTFRQVAYDTSFEGLTSSAWACGPRCPSGCSSLRARHRVPDRRGRDPPLGVSI